MPLLAISDKKVLHHILSQDRACTVSEVTSALAMSEQEVIQALDNLRRTGLTKTEIDTPGFQTNRWTLTSRGYQVGPSLVFDVVPPTNNPLPQDKVDPADGWGFPWKPVKAEAPVYAKDLSKRVSRREHKTWRPTLAVYVPEHPPKHRRWGLLFLATTLTLIGIGLLSITIRQVDIEISGINDAASLQPLNIEGKEISFNIDGTNARTAQIFLDDSLISGFQRYGNQIFWVVPPLPEGKHILRLTADRRIYGEVSREITFNIDGTPPTLIIPNVLNPVEIGQAVTISGISESDATVIVGGIPVSSSDGKFKLELDRPPAGPLSVLAIDEAGNTSSVEIVVPIKYPKTQAVHVSAAAWAYPALKNPIIDLIKAGKINAIELTLKNESGYLGYNSKLQLAREAGSIRSQFDLGDAIQELHSLGVRVIGRIVAFRDPILSQHAWNLGNKDWVLQGTNGQPLSKYGGFTNFYNEQVQEYNLAIATEAAEAGIDDILWDYMRRPEGSLDKMRIPGFTSSSEKPSSVINNFLAKAQSNLHEFDVMQGVSVFGIAATRGEQIAQDIPGMAKVVDYIAPMIYPSHWAKGEYGVSHPEAQPYEITLASLAEFQRVLSGTNTAIVPWLQDFTLRVEYGSKEVKAQIDAAADIGIFDWLLWDPTVTYTTAGIIPRSS
ncbi:MAG: putative glycoside hydrolase [Actinomycetota bacterium]|nr:putative glycoside hydrolase [Actinomycetota bacterium]MDG2120977.1 putative glycoside hydrolase [Actinomycetota bacterium]